MGQYQHEPTTQPHRHHHVGKFRRLFWTMLIVAVMVILFSNIFAMILGYTLPASIDRVVEVKTVGCPAFS